MILLILRRIEEQDAQNGLKASGISRYLEHESIVRNIGTMVFFHMECKYLIRGMSMIREMQNSNVLNKSFFFFFFCKVII